MRTNIPPTVTARPNLNSFAARRGPRNAVAAYDRRSSESGSVLHASDSESEFCIVDRQMQCKPECGHPAVNLHGLSLSRFSESVSIPGCQPECRIETLSQAAAGTLIMFPPPAA